MSRFAWLFLLGFTTAQAQAQGSARTMELEMQLLMRPNDPLLYVELALERERLGDRARAETTLRNGITAAADPRPVRAALTDFLARAERWNDAIAEAELLGRDRRTQAFVARLRVNAGLAFYRAGNKRAARTQWERALHQDPALEQAAVNLGSLLLELGERDAARALVEQALAFHPEQQQLLALRAATLGGAEAVVAAIAELRRRRAAAPADERHGLELASLLASTGKRREAAALYDTLLNAPAPSEAAFQSAGRFWVDGAQPALATQVIERGLETYPRSGSLYALLGEAQSEASEWRRAAAAYRRAAPLLANAEEAELPLIEVLLSAADTTDALDVVRAMALRPAGRDALLQAATHATAVHAPALADSVYRGLLARDSADIAALEASAAIAEHAGDTARAVTLYQRAVAQDSAGPIGPLGVLRLTHPDSADRRLLLRRAVWRGMDELQRLELLTAGMASGPIDVRTMKRSKPALERRKQIREVLKSTLDTVVLHTSWGPDELHQLRLAYPGSALLDRYGAAIAEREGRDSVALAVYDAVLRRDAADPETQQARATLLERTGRRREAIAAYSRALDLNPEDEAVFRSLQSLRKSDGSLAELLDQVRRLRVRLPASRRLVEREIEVLQRMGRLEEAAALALKLKESTR